MTLGHFLDVTDDSLPIGIIVMPAQTRVSAASRDDRRHSLVLPLGIEPKSKV